VKKTVFISIIILSLTAILSTDCEKRSEFRWGIKVGEITFNENSLFLGMEELALLTDVSADRLKFDCNKGALKTVVKNSLLVIGVSDKTPYGLLRKVVSVKSDGSALEIATSDATLAEAIKEGSIEFKKVLSEKDFYLKSKIDGVLAKGPEKSFDGLAVTMNEITVFKDADKTAGLTGSLGIGTQIDLTIRIEASSVKKFNTSITLNKIDEVSFRSTGSLNGRHEVNLAHFIHSPVIIDSLVFIPEIKINCGFDGTTVSGISSGVRQDGVITSTLNYSDNKWSADPVTYSGDHDFSRPQLSENSDIKVFSGPEITLYLFGIPLQIARTEGFYSLEADKTKSPFWRLFIGNEGKNTVKSTILGLSKDYLSAILTEPSEISNGN